jgi:hypothetical protein
VNPDDLTSGLSRTQNIQWNRLRAALFTLFKQSGAPDLPSTAVDIMAAWITTECDAIMLQCNAGPASPSSIFTEELNSEYAVPAGAFVAVIRELLDKAFHKKTSFDSMSHCIRVMFQSRHAVLRAMTSECPDPVLKGSFYDPRPTLCEAWVLAMNQLLRSAVALGGMESTSVSSEALQALQQLLIDTCVSTIRLLLYSSLGKTEKERINDPGMSFDGPQSLVMMEFLQLYFSLGSSMLQAVAKDLVKMIPIDHGSVEPWSKSHQETAGISIIGAALFRAVQGGLPPWAVEFIPAVYSSLYQALDSSPHTFGLVFEMSMHVRLEENLTFGGVKAGRLLSGRYFETMSDKTKQKFVSEAVELAKPNTQAGWKRLKALIKQNCGGKKKDTDYKQKPSLTKWDNLDRV